MRHDSRSSATPFLAVFVILAAVIIAVVPPSRRAPAQSESTKGRDTRALDASLKHRVVLIGVDGMHVKLVEEMPNVQQLFNDGSSTMKAQVPKGASTMLSFGALLTGADPKDSGFDHEPTGKGRHGKRCIWKDPVLVEDSIFTAVEASGRKVRAVTQKGKLCVALRPDKSRADIVTDGRAKTVIKTVCDGVQDDDVGFIFIHLKMIDDAGHRHGWLSEEQIAEAVKIDDQIGRIRACIDESNENGSVETILIVTADHGGTPGRKSNGKSRGHGANDDQNRLVPWIAYGPGIKTGYAIGDRADLFATKQGTQPSLLLYDTTATILRILGMSASSIPKLSPYAKSIDEIFVQP